MRMMTRSELWLARSSPCICVVPLAPLSLRSVGVLENCC